MIISKNMLSLNTQNDIQALYLDKFSNKNKHNSNNWLTLFNKYVKKMPAHLSVMSTSNTKLTYSELDQQSNQAANFLIQNGLTKGQIVATYIPRDNVDMVVWFIGILKAGGCVFQLESKLGQTVLINKLIKLGVNFLISYDYIFSNMLNDTIDNILTLESINSLENSSKKPNTIHNIDKYDAAFILISSGTTGEPKTMTIPHASLSDFSDFFGEKIKISHTSVLLQIASRNFDAATGEFLIAFGNGAMLQLINDDAISYPSEFANIIKNIDNGTCMITPSHITGILNCLDEDERIAFKQLSSIALVGEPFTTNLVSTLKHLGINRILNGYGLSEHGICSTISILYDESCSIDKSTIDLGIAVNGMNIRILKQNLYYEWVLCDINESGMLFTSNDLQYVYKNEELNKERYIEFQDPITGLNGIYFNTGDVACLQQDGNLVLVGRKDDQVKINGQLVVINEVENELVRISTRLFRDQDIQFYIEPILIDKQCTGLKAYHTANNQTHASEIIKLLLQVAKDEMLPYMIPLQFLWINKFKKKIGGKRDTAYIKNNAKPSMHFIFTESENEIEELLISFIKELKEYSPEDKISVETEFDYLGITSIELMSLLSTIRKQFNVIINQSDMFQFKNIRLLSNEISRLTTMDCHKEIDLSVCIKHGSSKYPIFLIAPGDGQIMVYSKLAKKLGNYTVYGFRMPGSEIGEDIEYYTVEEYAQMFIKLLLTLQPDGPIVVGGFCAGGSIAYEMAQQLVTEHNRTISLLFMIDTPNPQQSLDISNDTAFLPIFFKQTFNLDVSIMELEMASDILDEQIKFAVEKGKTLGIFNDSLNFDYIKRFIDMEASTRNSITNYKPSTYSGDNQVIFYKAAACGHEIWLPNPKKWTNVIPFIKVVQCIGDHMNMLKMEDSSQYLATKLLAQLD